MTKPPVTSDHRTGGALSRRERVREATLTEIKEIARRHLVEFGVVGVSLRAIAREMGMTAPGLYRYVSGIDALLVMITAEMYEELADVVSDADASMPSSELNATARMSVLWPARSTPRLRVYSGASASLDLPASFVLMA